MIGVIRGGLEVWYCAFNRNGHEQTGMRNDLRSLVLALAISFSALTAPAPAQTQVQTRAPAPAAAPATTVTTIARGLEHPWAVAFLPDGRFLVTERPGRMRVIEADGTVGAPVSGVPTVFASGQGGLLDVVLSPDFVRDRTIFFTFAEPRGAGTSTTSVARATLAANGNRLDGVRVLFRQHPQASGGLHFGSRIAIARDGHLFVVLGERYQMRLAQDVSTHYGKVIRITRDGGIPEGNATNLGVAAQKEIWSLGHRNMQSAAIHPVTGKLWTVEHGARGGDEINIPEAGKNYGWPVITYGIDYSGAKIGEGTAKAGMEQPIYYWDPSIAPSGMAFYTSDAVPAWKGNLFVGALAGRHLSRLVLEGERVVAEQRLLTDLGERIRDVRAGADGALYLVTDAADGRLLRVTAR
jgi:glucose/arabinose dehydrogenase